ncbi:hypothetical protein C7H19_09600 [Aphanothece hegewaldii CCALA 016]|uniref:DNA-binding domain-containing protein n=1 Tax=Aphanothece hegewaldii CCALA 016 TaxID=2107694 RepID=A0A2T1LYU5_9CHRO|nr:hypothetical protein C7H19_09600 [Aphanothece hegewaldii CCALA 016]
MSESEITNTLNNYFGSETVARPTPEVWQVDTDQLRLLLMLSSDQTLIRILVPIVPLQTAQSYLIELLEANFDLTQMVRFAIHQGVVWGVFQHFGETLTTQDLKEAIDQLVWLHQNGLNECFKILVEKQVRQIIRASKLQGQSLEATLQSLNRLYEEGMLGGLDQDSQEREQFLSAWKLQLERLWDSESIV